MHAGGTLDSVSLHVTLAVRTVNRDWLLGRLCERFLSDAENRADPAVPMADREAFVREIECTARRFASWLANADVETIGSEAFEARGRQLGPPHVEALQVSLDRRLLEDCVLRCRPYLAAGQRLPDGTYDLRFSGVRYRIGGAAAELLDWLISNDVREATPSELDGVTSDANAAIAELIGVGLIATDFRQLERRELSDPLNGRRVADLIAGGNL